MNVEKAQNAVAASEEHKRQKQQMQSGATLQPMGLQMGALGKPNGQMPSPMYSNFNRV